VAEKNAEALNAATIFELDDVIDPAETRHLLSSTIAAAASAGRPERGRCFVDPW